MFTFSEGLLLLWRAPLILMIIIVYLQMTGAHWIANRICILLTFTWFLKTTCDLIKILQHLSRYPAMPSTQPLSSCSEAPEDWPETPSSYEVMPSERPSIEAWTDTSGPDGSPLEPPDAWAEFQAPGHSFSHWPYVPRESQQLLRPPFAYEGREDWLETPWDPPPPYGAWFGETLTEQAELPMQRRQPFHERGDDARNCEHQQHQTSSPFGRVVEAARDAEVHGAPLDVPDV